MTYILKQKKPAFITALLTGILLLSVSSAQAYFVDPPVFPGAEGFGVRTPAGRGGAIYRVTNLNESGAGSLRAAVEASGPRIVIFEISGTIRLGYDLNIANPYITIAGQTAPSPGIIIRGAGIRTNTHDILIQHLRIRVGDSIEGPPPEMRRAVSIGTNSYNVIIDHCSLSWGVDSNADIWGRGIRDITFSNCILSEGLDNSIHPKGPHSKGMTIGPGDLHRLALIKNLLTQNATRNPHINGNTSTLLVNNVVYNPQFYAADLTEDREAPEGPQSTTVVSCTVIPGVNTTTADHVLVIFEWVSNGVRVYAEDNECPLGIPGDPWSSVRIDCAQDFVVKESAPSVWTSPLSIIPTKNEQALNWVLENAGARPTDRDSVDTRVVRDVRNLTGHHINSQNEVGGWPQLAVNRRTLNVPSDPHGDSDGDGYTNIEEWLHDFDPNAPVPDEPPPPPPPTTHSISMPTPPELPAFGTVNIEVKISTSNSQCSLGHDVEYQFDWGDGYFSGWTSTGIKHRSWLKAGTYTLRAQSRCTYDTSIKSGWSAGRTITISSSGSTGNPTLGISSDTCDSAPGPGGTTSPAPGIYSYATNQSVQLSANPKSQYRFARWTGDVTSSQAVTRQITLTMSQSRSVTAHFATLCGDINGDLQVSPTDSQLAFDIFLNLAPGLTPFQMENADVNSDGTKSEPMVTPTDAQAIFERFLGVSDLPSDCSCESRSGTLSALGNAPSLGKIQSSGNLLSMETAANETLSDETVPVRIGQVIYLPENRIEIPLIFEGEFYIKAFGLDILFPEDELEFKGIAKTKFLRDFLQAEATLLEDNIIRFGGYSQQPIKAQYGQVMVKLIFEIDWNTYSGQPLKIKQVFDDLKNKTRVKYTTTNEGRSRYGWF